MLTQSFADALLEAEKVIAAAPHIQTPQDLAEGYDYLAGSIQASMHLAWAYQRDFPYFVQSTGPYTKMGLDNPDTLYLHAYLREDAEYIVTGRRGTTRDLSFQVLNGDYSPVEVPDSLTAFDDRELAIGRGRLVRAAVRPAQGRPAAPLLHPRPRLGHARRPRGVQRLGRREARHAADPAGRQDRAGAAGRRTRTLLAKRYRVAGKILLSRLRTFLAFPDWFYLNEPVNTMTSPRRTPGGLASQFSSAGHFDLAPDEAMIVTVPDAGRELAPYQGIQLGSMWYISLDYINHQTSLTADQARLDPDGRLRFVISDSDPGVANWLELTGRRRGYVQIRWQRLAADLGPEHGPEVQVVPVGSLPESLPYYEQARLAPGEYAARIAARQAAVAERMLG